MNDTPIPPSVSSPRVRARSLGIVPGILPAGALNAITDVAGVSVGHVTLIEGDSIRTGATAILPHPGNLYRERVPAGIVVGNGYGKLMGSTPEGWMTPSYSADPGTYELLVEAGFRWQL